jgi:hypothetical protein
VIAFQSLDPATDALGRSSGYRSADGRTARGVELGVRLQPHRTTRAAVAYTLVDTPPPAGTRDGLPRASTVSAHQFSGLVTYTRGPLQLSVEIEAAGDHYVALFDPVTFASRAYRFGDVTKSDVAASYRLPAGRTVVRLFAAVDNAYNRTYFVQGFRTAGRTARGGFMVTL